jgi:peptide/nickel transport system ATP-binding protein
MALAASPKLLIADEPTTALDVTIQAQILDLLRQLQADEGMSILFITHDLGVVAEMADEVAVMYASKVVERAAVGPLFAEPLHPYTYLLFKSRPRLGEKRGLSPFVRSTLGAVPANGDCPPFSGRKGGKLDTIEGMVPSPLRFPAGCKFHPRCPFRQPKCETIEPELRQVRPEHWARCHFAGELPLKAAADP